MKQTNVIAPSILAANFAKLGQECQDVINAGAQLIHFDVMDNLYVPQLSFGSVICKSLRDYGIKTEIDVHLMVENPDNIIDSFIEAGASYITIHPETTKHLHRTIQKIKQAGIKAGLVFNPTTSFECLEYIKNDIDMIVLMSVNPGFGGQQFIEKTYERISIMRKFIDDNNLSCRLEVDGGIKLGNIKEVAKAGADTFVVGSAIFSEQDYQAVINKMNIEIANY